MPKLKLYIVEDSSIIRENLSDALRESAPVEVVGSAEDERRRSLGCARAVMPAIW